MEKLKFFYSLIFISIFFPIKEDRYTIPNGENYIIGEDGIKRIYINVWGHVKYPGTYLVYENIDIATLLSMAGGPIDGADLDKIELISKDKGVETETIDFFENLSKSKSKFKPYDTIKIKPSTKFYLRENAYLINVLLQILTLGLTINN